MTSIIERQTDILKLISQLDISPSMYKDADSKYHALATFLEENGITAEIYPQGSFALGTVVRPCAIDPNAAYDLDFICQVSLTKGQISPSELRKMIETTLSSSDRYSDKLTVCKECLTINYAGIGKIGFTIDIVPACDEDNQYKEELKRKSIRPDLLSTAIAIPRHNGNRNYDWITNNPRGFRFWFEEINKPFLSHNRDIQRMTIFESNRMIFDSVDDIPDALVRSSMQRVIQILKYHRDIYYLNLPNLSTKEKKNLKPISAIINTLVASISRFASPEASVFELLRFVLKELNIYSQHLTVGNSDFVRMFGTRNIITRTAENRKWVIQNPANPDDNLADQWNKNTSIPEHFFRWVTACEVDLLKSLSLSDSQFRSAMENAFGTATIQRSWSDKYKSTLRAEPKPIVTVAKPYRK